MKCKYLLLFLLFISFSAAAQLLSEQPIARDKTVPQINYPFNRVSYGNLDAFYKKLAQLKDSSTGVVNIVHIGDSHIQADFLSSVVRNELQIFFGNAGRGLVFPYQIAKSNAPVDISSSSNVSWQYNRLAHLEIPIKCGISGYCVETSRPMAKINLSLKSNENGTQDFNKLKFFVDTNFVSSWLLETNTDMMPVIFDNDSVVKITQTVNLDKAVTGFALTSRSAGDKQSFYGVSLENGNAGVLLHTIGVNGAKYEQYNNSPLFWQQLPALNADLIIVSLGTNEAQNVGFNPDNFLIQVGLFIQKVKETLPNAVVLVTTPQDSYRGNRSNDIMRKLNNSLTTYCQQNNIALWDLYKVTNGYGSAKNWLRKGLMNKDRIHFTSPGYKLQGKLLFNALAKGYNNYLKTYQNFK